MPELDEWRGRPALVTGGAGFIGSHLVARLAAAGARVSVIDDLRSGTASQLPEGARHVSRPLDRESLAAALSPDAVIFHCAGSAYVPPSVEDPVRDFELNLRLTLEVLDHLRTKQSDATTVLFSSAAVYGNPRGLPVREDDPPDPISPYGVAKLAAERYGAVFARLYGLRIASLRFFSVYGPGQRKQVVYDLLTRMRAGGGELTVLGDGTQVRDFCFVDDAVQAALTVAARGELRGETYNVGSGEGTSIANLLTVIGEAMGVKPKPVFTGSIRPGDADAWVADTPRLRALGWEPRTPLLEGLRRTADWALTHAPTSA